MLTTNTKYNRMLQFMPVILQLLISITSIIGPLNSNNNNWNKCCYKIMSLDPNILKLLSKKANFVA